MSCMRAHCALSHQQGPSFSPVCLFLSPFPAAHRKSMCCGSRGHQYQVLLVSTSGSDEHAASTGRCWCSGYSHFKHKPTSTCEPNGKCCVTEDFPTCLSSRTTRLSSRTALLRYSALPPRWVLGKMP